MSVLVLCFMCLIVLSFVGLRCDAVWNVVLCCVVRCVVVAVMRKGVCACGWLCFVSVGIGVALCCVLLVVVLCCCVYLWCCVLCCIEM